MALFKLVFIFFLHASLSVNAGIVSSVRDTLLPPPPPPPPSSSALEGCSADGRSPTGRLFRPNALPGLRLRLRWLSVAFFCSRTDWSRAARYNGDHFLENTGKEEGCQ